MKSAQEIAHKIISLAKGGPNVTLYLTIVRMPAGHFREVNKILNSLGYSIVAKVDVEETSKAKKTEDISAPPIYTIYVNTTDSVLLVGSRASHSWVLERDLAGI